MTAGTWETRRDAIETYFDRTAVEAWSRLTSTEPVGRVRATVRAGRDAMRSTILSWLPDDLTARRLLDAGCGPGALSIEAARRGARVTAVDLSPNLLDLARRRLPRDLGPGAVTFVAGDMLDPAHGRFDHAVLMDSLIHYEPADAAAALAALAPRVERSIVLTFAPRTPLLAAMHAAGRFFPRADRAPSIVPVSPARLLGLLASRPELADWRPFRRRRVAAGFYISEALELARA